MNGGETCQALELLLLHNLRKGRSITLRNSLVPKGWRAQGTFAPLEVRYSWTLSVLFLEAEATVLCLLESKDVHSWCCFLEEEFENMK